MSEPNQNLVAAHAEVKAEISRTDNKVALLLAFAVAVLAGVWTVGDKLTVSTPAGIAAAVADTVAAGLVLRSVAALLSGVRPNSGGRHGFPLWATLTPEQVSDHAARWDLAADVAGLSRLTVAKYRSIQRAVDLLKRGGAVLVLAAVLAVGGALWTR
ncbi:Pycsar system effector family protein [Streptomyces sp. NPDC087425]|uniref:Pycsar system effector family protein n=1 Tax=Streptomyces sp. NPDC087425 TaxID=3365787 RepID=UPI0038171696